jgi:hypothetical protein
VGLRRAPARALLVPDDETWLFSGVDVGSRYQPTLQPGRARILATAERLPPELGDALRAAWEEMPSKRRLDRMAAPFVGHDVQTLITEHDHAGHQRAEEHAHHGEGHDHGDMMAITGEPSADGLVMESLDIQAGPLGVALPTGLVFSAVLDGDIVCRCEVAAALDVPEAVPDPGAPVAWALASAIRATASLTWLDIARLECERALSHLSWLHRFLRLVGWLGAAAELRRVIRRLLDVREALAASASVVELQTIASSCAAVEQMLENSGAFRRRTAGLGRLSEQDARRRGLVGPTAWASSVNSDSRSREPAYAELGFEPVQREEGDARARTLVRADDAWQSLLLLSRAVQRLGDEAPSVAMVEGPRGPLDATRAPDEAARAAGDLAVGSEWAAALVVVASFDLSPWSVEA